MKTAFLVIPTLLLTTVLTAQNDRRLKERTDSMLRFTQLSDMEKILDFTYPKLFSIVPRDKMLESLKSTFDNEELAISIDSVQLDSIYPVFTVGDAWYAKINHSQLMLMHLKEKTDSADKESVAIYLGAMKEQFGEENVRFDTTANTIRIQMKSEMIAVKDRFSPEWSFINYKEEDEIFLPSLFGKEVLEKIKSFQ